MLKYECQATDRKARAGTVTTKHGSFDTPIFMPVGTVGTVKGLTPETVKATGARIILGNTYHLMLRPGAERVARLGGLHKMMNWPGPILTDSGGFQVMSLAKLRKMDQDGVTFSSHIDGSKHRLTPERSVEIQDLLDATITMQLDECVANPATHAEADRAMRLSLAWAERSQKAWRSREGYGIFGIVQGSVFEDLRTISSRELVAMDFQGYAVGGLAVGEGQEAMFRVLDFSVELLPAHKPRYLMGVGTPDDLLGGVARGIDMFDCVMPTRAGRTGRAFTSQGILNIRNARFADDIRPLDPACLCPLCQNYARGYLHHLFKAEEMLGPILLSTHNLTYYQSLMQQMRQAIIAGRLADFSASVREAWLKGDTAS